MRKAEKTRGLPPEKERKYEGTPSRKRAQIRKRNKPSRPTRPRIRRIRAECSAPQKNASRKRNRPAGGRLHAAIHIRKAPFPKRRHLPAERAAPRQRHSGEREETAKSTFHKTRIAGNARTPTGSGRNRRRTNRRAVPRGRQPTQEPPEKVRRGGSTRWSRWRRCAAGRPRT